MSIQESSNKPPQRIVKGSLKEKALKAKESKFEESHQVPIIANDTPDFDLAKTSNQAHQTNVSQFNSGYYEKTKLSNTIENQFD